MAKFQFRLQNILSVKEKFEEQKKMELSTANEILKLEEKKLQVLVDLREKNDGRYRKSIGNKMKVSDIKEIGKINSFYSDGIIEQNTVIDKACNQVELKRKELQKALIEKKMYEKLKDNALEEFFIEESKEEQKHLDEIVSYKYRKI